MNAFETYKDYLALKNHFSNKNYNYFKYAAGSKVSLASFEKRKDKYFFEKLAKHREPHDFMVANFAKNPKYWIRDLAYSEECVENYTEWSKRLLSITYEVQKSLSLLEEDFNENFIVTDNEHPPLLRLYMSGAVSAEVFVVLVQSSKCLNYWNKKMANDFIWSDISTFITKYSPFITYDKDKISKLIVDKFE